MRFAKVILPVSVVALAAMSGTSTRAAIIESATLDNWSLAAFSDNRSRDFQLCSMSTSAGEGTDFILSLNGQNRWGLWLRRSEWPIEQDAPLIATLNLDTGKKAGIAIETSLKANHLLALPLPREVKLPVLFDGASTVRVALEHKLHVTFSLKNYTRAVDWVKACVGRHAEPKTVTAPDATIRSEKNNASRDDGTVDMEPDPKETKPSPVVPVPQKPAKNPTLIEASVKGDTGSSNEKPASPVALTPPTEPKAAPVPPETKPQAGAPSQIVAGIATALSMAASATTADVVEPRGNGGARDLLPGLMQAAKLTHFKLLPDAQAPRSLSRADAVFEMEGLRGAAVSLETPSAAIGMNDVLAHDRITCGGSYASNSATVDPASADVVRATTRCEVDGQVTVGHFVTMARKGGGYYVVTVMAQVPASMSQTNPVGDVSATLDEAALAVTGKF